MKGRFPPLPSLFSEILAERRKRKPVIDPQWPKSFSKTLKNRESLNSEIP